jgi:hypothetical protein
MVSARFGKRSNFRYGQSGLSPSLPLPASLDSGPRPTSAVGPTSELWAARCSLAIGRDRTGVFGLSSTYGIF